MQLKILLPLKIFLSSEGGLSLNSSLPILKSQNNYWIRDKVSSPFFLAMIPNVPRHKMWLTVTEIIVTTKVWYLDSLWYFFMILFVIIEIQRRIAERRCHSVEMESTASLSLKGTDETRYQRRNWRLIEKQNVSNFAEDPGPLLLRILKMLKSLRLIH